MVIPVKAIITFPNTQRKYLSNRSAINLAHSTEKILRPQT